VLVTLSVSLNRTNFSFFFTFWDDLHNTTKDKVPGCTLLVLAAHAVFQAAFMWSFSLPRPGTVQPDRAWPA